VTINAHFEEISQYLSDVYKGGVKVDLVKVDDYKNSVDVLKHLSPKITKDIIII
jgi:hypothetical protein